tara:strand:+ start:1183 stop:1419 length:237 start_codon:yes stop_codon:yes gene_type:complete
MYVRCEKRGLRIEGEWVPKGKVKKVSKKTAEALRTMADAGELSLHTKDPAAKRVSARKARTAPGLEAIEKAEASKKAE